MDAYGLFTKGLRWSYRKYGLKGAAAFVLVGLVAYYVVNEKLEDVLEGEADGVDPEEGEGATTA